MYGKCDGTGTKTTYTGSMVDPMSGQEVTVKQTVTWIDDNTFQGGNVGWRGLQEHGVYRQAEVAGFK